GGTFGTALSHRFSAHGLGVRLWVHQPEIRRQIVEERENKTYLPGFKLAESLRATTDLAEALADPQVVLMVVPSHVFRSVLVRMRPHLPRPLPVISAAKGIENDSLLTMVQVMEQELDESFHGLLGCLSGPSFAKELAAEVPTAVTLATRVPSLTKRLQGILAVPRFRIYASGDVTGLELGGALKNVIAIAAGMVVGLQLGRNALAALITRGLAEMSRLTRAMGGRMKTMGGLAGIGDLVLTCTSTMSRNHTVGVRLAQGESLDDILASMTNVAEGVKTTKSVFDLSRQRGVEMPICEQVYAILYQGKPPLQGLIDLMSRELKEEFY
ncbi:MAG: NAD(P)-dependent glycerol-3-phosphate dehydrogenase, partial [Proteobacteria bacterium]|nr:NAD(P)-dependent glycerol-3-phosphate dehydrogenase [Pseudomonadota bacterium]